VLGEPDRELRPAFEAEQPGALWVRDDDFGVMTDRPALGGHVVDLRTPHGEHEEVFLPVHGAHQADNAALAVAAVEAFFGRALHPDVVAEAFAELRLPGRFEIVHRAPLVVLDGAHNAESAAAAAVTLAEEFAVAGTRHWVLGVLAGRDLDEMLDAYGFAPGDRVVATTPPSPRGVPAAELAVAVERRGVPVETVEDLDGAVAAAWHAAEAAGEGDLVIVTGSLHTVGAARTACRHLGLLSG
jgi:dihydrofolate synthase / folylpolyglutamate synthase